MRENRRQFVCRLGATGLCGLAAFAPRPARAEPPPEVLKVRLVHAPALCLSPQYVAEDLLHAEGFTQVQYVELATNTVASLIADGGADLSMDATTDVIPHLDAGRPIVVLAGVHAGCYELFAHPQVRAVRDLKGKRVAISAMNSAEHVYVASIHARPAMVAVFLLLAGGQSQLRGAPSCRDQACAARDPEGRRHLRRRSAACGAADA